MNTPRPKTNPHQWAVAIIEALRQELATLIAQLPPAQRDAVGAQFDWSPKDEMAHLAYWIELFGANIQARRDGKPLTDTRLYLAMNDRAWLKRKDWTWAEVEAALDSAFNGLAEQLQALSADELTDPQHFTLEAERAAPRPLMRSLVYELVEHPLHHMVGLYEKFGDDTHSAALLSRMATLMRQPGTAKWTATAKRKTQAYGVRFQSQAALE